MLIFRAWATCGLSTRQEGVEKMENKFKPQRGIPANFREIFLIFALEIAKHQKAGILEKTSFVIFIWMCKTKSFKLEIFFFLWNMSVFSLPSVSHQQLLISTPSKFFRPAVRLTNLSVTVVQHWSKEMKNHCIFSFERSVANSWDFLKKTFGTGRHWSALYSTHQNHIDREGLRLNFGHLVTCYTNERCLRCFDVFASRGFGPCTLRPI